MITIMISIIAGLSIFALIIVTAIKLAKVKNTPTDLTGLEESLSELFEANK